MGVDKKRRDELKANSEAASHLGRLGGNATKKKHGKDYYSTISKMRRTHGPQKPYKECDEEEKLDRDLDFTWK